MPLIEMPADPVGDALKLCAEVDKALASVMAQYTTRVIDAVSVIREAFFADARVGASGARLLESLKDHVGLVAKYNPEHMTPSMLNAGAGLEANPDGTVTVNPLYPVAPEPEPGPPPGPGEV